MSEADAIESVDEPVTVETIEAGLRDLGVVAGDTLLVHSSLSSSAGSAATRRRSSTRSCAS